MMYNAHQAVRDNHKANRNQAYRNTSSMQGLPRRELYGLAIRPTIESVTPKQGGITDCDNH